MQSINKVQLAGHLGEDPILKDFGKGKLLAILRVATHYTYQKDGQEYTATTWHTVKAWDDQAILAKDKFARGSAILVNGRLVTHSYADKSGETRYSTDVVANQLEAVGN